MRRRQNRLVPIFPHGIDPLAAQHSRDFLRAARIVDLELLGLDHTPGMGTLLRALSLAIAIGFATLAVAAVSYARGVPLAIVGAFLDIPAALHAAHAALAGLMLPLPKAREINAHRYQVAAQPSRPPEAWTPLYALTTPMTVVRGASAMVSMVLNETEGEVVYLYAPDSEQAGMLARAQEIENLEKQGRAPALIAVVARRARGRAEAAYSDAAQRLTTARKWLAITAHRWRRAIATRPMARIRMDPTTWRAAEQCAWRLQ